MCDLPFANLNADELQNLFSHDISNDMNVNNRINFSMLDSATELHFIENDDDVFETQWNTDPDKNFLIDSNNKCIYVQHKTLNDCLTTLKPQDLTMMEVNIRSLPKNHDSLKMLLNSVQDKIHIITVVETWLTKSTVDHYELEGY